LRGLAETAPQAGAGSDSVQPGWLVTLEVASVVTGIDADRRVKLAASKEYFRGIHIMLNEPFMIAY
jgi:hypothetical protein